MKTQVRSSKRDPEGNRSALIDATLESIAEIGISETTVSKIIERAGLSRGMIHLHFGGKSQLLTAAAEAFSDRYYAEVDRRLLIAGTSPEAVVMAVISADLSEKLLNERNARIVHALRGAASSHAGIAMFSSTRDERLREMIHAAFSEIAAEYGQDNTAILARDATFGLLALLEGMWVDFLSNSNSFSRKVAISIVTRFLAGLFPNHFQQKEADRSPNK